MATKKKRDKAYRPRQVRTNIAALLFDSDKPLQQSDRESILGAAHWSVQALARGEATKDDWHTIVNALNCSQVLCEKAGNREVGLAVIYAAQNAMINIGERCKALRALRLGVGDLPRLNEAMSLYEVCWPPSRSNSTPRRSSRQTGGSVPATSCG
ncbi:hypothetical protein [Cupriavidus necator]|uniref:hypothetical protein n=1 Tax=Cupriavidus necator TaxID=106590 RepID=UPI0005B471D5|nr:hypothetical protein [Cupriavidus necator]